MVGILFVLEELADLLEVIYAVAKARGYSIEELEMVQKEKQKNAAALINGYGLKE